MHILIYLLYLLIIIGVFLLCWALIEPKKLKVKRDEINIYSDNQCNARIIYLSDLHAEFCFIPSDKICDIIRAEHKETPVDAIVFGGDICNNPKKYQIGANYLNKIAAVCQELDIPFIGTNGNHDVKLTAKEISLCGFKDISGTNFSCTNRNNQTILFSGIADSGRKNRTWMEIPSHDNNHDLHIVLSHNPDQILHFTDNIFDVMLSGHIHGGQIRTPFKIEFTLLRKDELPKQNIYAGLYDVCGKKLYISKGIGCVSMPFRLGARPEVNIININKYKK